MGIFFSIILWLISSLFITDVLIVGDISITSKQIMHVLSNNNINRWTLKSNVDIQTLQSQIQDIKFISYASVIIKGNALVINIKEQLTNAEVVLQNNYQPLISNFEGKIVSLKLLQGTLNVQVGDIVKLGDILVQPYVIDADGTRRSVQPLADIVCEVWITTRMEYFNKQTKKTYTGNYVTNYKMSFLGLQIFKSQNKVNYVNYDMQVSQKYLTNYLLPIKMEYTKFLEYNLEEVVIDFDLNKQKFIEQTRQMALLNVKEYDIIKNESYTVIPSEQKNTVVYTITLNKKIC